MTARRLAAAAALLLALPAGAQTDACREAVALAEARYVQGAFDAVEPLLGPCLDTAGTSVPAYRLLALARLRSGAIAEAKLALLRILAVRPDYEPDPALDPPDYVALIRVVKGQIALDRPAPLDTSSARPAEPLPGPPDPVASAPAAPPAPPEAPAGEEAAPDRLPTFSYHLSLGAGSYGGERGASGSGPVAEFANNAGPAFGIGVSTRLLPWLRLVGDLEATQYPTITTPKEGDTFDSPVFDDSAGLSSWVRTATVGAHVLLRRGGLAPYVVLGGGVALGGQGGSQAAGLGTAGLGVDVPLFVGVGAYLEGTGSLASPARALDGAAGASDRADPFTAVRLGLRYGVGR